MMKDLHYAVSPYYYGILGTLSSVFFIVHGAMVTNAGLPSRLGPVDFLLFAGVGLTSALGAMSKSLAFQYEKVSTLAALKYTNLFYSLAADVLLFHSHIYPGELVGAALIIGSTVVIGVLKYYGIV
jgi:drug/metabolite transporter (DMT)-like permease